MHAKRTFITLTMALIPGGLLTMAALRPASGEIIEVHACRVGTIEVGQGDDWRCVPVNTGGDSHDLDPPGVPRDDSGDGGGATPLDTRPRPSREGIAEARAAAKRKLKCQACKRASTQCLAQAVLARDTCFSNASAMAATSCAIGGNPADALTSWGIPLTDLAGGRRTGEDYWDNRDWSWQCGHKTPKDVDLQRYACWGPGLDNCVGSWAANHPLQTDTHSGSASATFGDKGLGATGSTSVSTTYTWGGRNGYNSVCETVGRQLSWGCTGRQNACYDASGCTAGDLEP